MIKRMPKKWVNVAIVGCGRIYNDAHRQAYVHKSTDHAVVIGFCDIRENLATDQMNWMKSNYEKLLAKAQKKNEVDDIERLKFGLENMKVYTSYEKMLAELEGKLDLIDNCTPGRLHIPLSVQALEHGINAMAEKPPALNWWDVKRIVRAEQKSGKMYALQENVCYERPVQKMRQVVLENKLGKIKNVNIEFGHNGPYIPYHFGDSGLPHFIDPLWSGGGCLQDLAPHGISKAFWPIGPGSKVIACDTKKLERRRSPRDMSGKPFDNKLDDWAEADLELYDPRTKSNYTMKCTTSWCGKPSDKPFEIEGENGTLLIQKHLIKFTYEPCIIGPDKKETFLGLEKDNWETHEGHIREIQIFCDHVRRGIPSDTPGDYALHLQEIISMQYFSKLMKKRVTIEEMETWGQEIIGKYSDEQKGIDEIAMKLTSAVDQLKMDV